MSSSFSDSNPLTSTPTPTIPSLTNGSTPDHSPNSRRAEQHTPNRLPSALRTVSGLSPQDGTSPRDSSPGAADSTDGENSPWVGAVGRASLGKSGRVIERLMADIDKLKRELNAEVQRRQELEKREEATRSAAINLRAENANLAQAKEVDATMLKRRDRMVAELKRELDSEKTRREQAERNATAAAQELDEAQGDCRRQIGEAREMSKHASGHAEVLEQSHRQLRTEYKQRVGSMTKDLQKMEQEREEEKQRVRRLDVVVEQLSHDLERATKASSKMEEFLREYKADSESRMATLQRQAEERDATEAAQREEVERVMGEARWLINLNKNAHARMGAGPVE